MLHSPPGELQRAHLFLAWQALAHGGHARAGWIAHVEALQEHAARDAAKLEALPKEWLIHAQQAAIPPAAPQSLKRGVAEGWRDNGFDEEAAQGRHQGLVDLAIQGDDAAKSRERVRCQCLRERLGQGAGAGDAGRVSGA